MPSFLPFLFNSFLPYLLSSFLPYLLNSFLIYFLPSFLPYLLPFLFTSFLPYLLPSFLPYLLPSFLIYLLTSLFTSFLPYLLPSLFTYFLPSLFTYLFTSFLPYLLTYLFTSFLPYLLTYLLPYLVTYSIGQILEKLTGFQPVKKFPAFYGTRKFITAFTIGRHLSLSWASSIQSVPPHPTSRRSNLIYWTCPVQAHNIPRTKSHVPFSFLRPYWSISPGQRQVFIFRNKASFYGEKMSAPRPNPKLEGHPFSAVRDCLFNIFASNLHIWSRSKIRNPRKRHAVLTRTDLPQHRITIIQHAPTK